ncbi:hypothetical protein C8R45DRAFT_295833 [Mycena sanguinolenta]|nr:hypothetical protein C8R45DRAFT_295833 [Mycena sanguinolenta]
MPQLRRFEVSPFVYSHLSVGYDVGYEVLERLATNSPLLSAIGFCFDFADCSHFLGTLQRLPHLTSLSLSCSRPEQNATPLLASLSPGPDSPIPSPGLRQLELFDSIWLEDTFLKFIETQLQYNTNLQHLHLFLWDDPPAVMPDLESFRVRGLRVLVTFTRPHPKPSLREGIELQWL